MGTYEAYRRRNDAFIAYLRTLGAGEECITVPWLSPTADSSGNAAGYGRLLVAGERIQAHRWVYEQVIGPVPADLDVCHTCDNPPCVRPSHLWAGTPSENALDAFAKGRRKPGPGTKGESHGSAKLTVSDVRRIRTMAAQGFSQRQIARLYGITQSNVPKILRGVLWATVPLDPDEVAATIHKPGRRPRKLL